MSRQSESAQFDIFFKTLSDTSTDIIHLNNEQGEIIYANPASEHLLGYTREELYLTPSAALIHPEDLDTITADMAQAAKNTPPPARPVRLQKKDGTYIDVEVRGFTVPTENGTYIGAIIRDISKYIELERKRILFSDSVLQSQLETTRDGILVVSHTNKILLTNSRFHTMWSIRPEIAALQDDEIQIKTVLDQLIDPEAFISRVQFLYDHPEEISQDTLHLKDGRIFDRYSAPLYDSQQQHLARIWYFHDITQAKRLEEEKIKTKKLASVGVLAGGIAHDFNNLLAAILGNIDLSNYYLKGDEKVTPLLEEASNACLLAQNLTQQLLTFAQGGAPVTQTVQLKNVMEECCRFSLRGSNVDCKFSFADDLWPATCDSNQIHQVLQNLLINAQQAMPRGGTIDISSENVHHPGSAKLRAGTYLKIQIRDYGAGISAEHIGNIFDPYFTTKGMNSEKGTGLGLAIVHSIVTKHNGSIEVQSEKGKGSTFTIMLPASSEQEETSEGPGQPVKGKILVMDDEDIVLKMCQEILIALGYAATIVSSGKEAVTSYEQAMKDGNPFHAAILDITIPGGMGGEETAAAILRIDPQAKLIVSSGYATSPIISSPADYGFCDVLVKPYQVQVLAETLERTIAKG